MQYTVILGDPELAAIRRARENRGLTQLGHERQQRSKRRLDF